LTDALYIAMCVNHFGKANIKKKKCVCPSVYPLAESVTNIS